MRIWESFNHLHVFVFALLFLSSLLLLKGEKSQTNKKRVRWLSSGQPRSSRDVAVSSRCVHWSSPKEELLRAAGRTCCVTLPMNPSVRPQLWRRHEKGLLSVDRDASAGPWTCSEDDLGHSDLPGSVCSLAQLQHVPPWLLGSWNALIIGHPSAKCCYQSVIARLWPYPAVAIKFPGWRVYRSRSWGASSRDKTFIMPLNQR